MSLEMTIEQILHTLQSREGLIPTLGIQLEVDAGVVIGYLTIGTSHRGSPNAAHGGAVMTLLDTVLGMEAFNHALQQGQRTSTVELKTNFLRPVRIGQRLVVRPELLSKGKSLLVMSGSAIDLDTKERVAFAVGTFNLFGHR